MHGLGALIRTAAESSAGLVVTLLVTSALPTAHAEPAFSLPAPLCLGDVVSIARTRRAEIAAARARARAFEQRPGIVGALEEPMLSPSLDHVPFMMHGANVSLSVEQRFPLSGVLGHRERAARADARRARAEADSVMLDVALDATTAFLMLSERRRSASILAEQRALARQFSDAATARYASGNGTQADALRAEIEIARLDGALSSIDAELRGAELMLLTSLGLVPQTPPLPELETRDIEAEPPSPDVVRATALRNRPELRAGAAEVDRARAEVDVMDAMYMPMAMIRTGPAYTMAEGWGFMLMAGVSVPLWREKLRAGVNEAQAMAEMASDDLVAMRQMVVGEALSRREQSIAALRRLVTLRDEVVPRAHAAVAANLAAYSAGQLPLVSVLEAAQALWSAQGELAAVYFELGMAWARLHRAMGDEGFKP